MTPPPHPQENLFASPNEMFANLLRVLVTNYFEPLLPKRPCRSQSGLGGLSPVLLPGFMSRILWIHWSRLCCEHPLPQQHRCHGSVNGSVQFSRAARVLRRVSKPGGATSPADSRTRKKERAQRNDIDCTERFSHKQNKSNNKSSPGALCTEKYHNCSFDMFLVQLGHFQAFATELASFIYHLNCSTKNTAKVTENSRNEAPLLEENVANPAPCPVCESVTSLLGLNTGLADSASLLTWLVSWYPGAAFSLAASF